MEWIIIAMLLVGVLFFGVLWLIATVIQSKKKIEELSYRLARMEADHARWKNEGEFAETEALTPEPTPEETTVEKILREQQERQASTEVAPPPVSAATPSPSLAIPPVIPEPSPIPEPSAVPPPIPTFAQSAEPTTTSLPPIFVSSSESPRAETPPEFATPPPVTAEKGSFEMRLGTYWLVRVGIVMLLTGLVFFGNYAYHNFIGKLGPGGKVSLLYLASALLLGAGAWWQRKASKEALRNYGQVLFAGGLALVYFTTYAAHHIMRLRIIESAFLDGILLLAWAAFIAWIADRKKSEVLALFAVGLAYYTSVMTQVGAFTLYSNLVLTLAAVFFLVRNRWAWLSFASLVLTYASYSFWRFFHGGEWRWANPDEGLWLGAYFLMSYWVVFTAAVFLSKHEKMAGQNRGAFLTFNNGAFFTLFLLTMIQVHSGKFWQFSLIYGSVLLVLVEVSRRIFPDEPLTKNSYLTQGLLLVTLGFITKFSGLQLALVLGAESIVLFILGTARRSLILQIGAYISGAMSVGWGFDGLDRDDPHGIWLGSALGAFMVVNAFWAHRQERENRATLRAVPSYFSALALLVWCFATWQYTTHQHFGLVLTIEALLLALSIYVLCVRELALLGQIYLLVAQVAWQFDVSKPAAQLTALMLAIHSLVLLLNWWRRAEDAWRICGQIVAMLAIMWGIAGLERYETHGLLTGVALAAIMLLTAFLTRRKTLEAEKTSLQPEPAYFSTLLVVIAAATTWFNTSQSNCPLFFAGEAILLTASVYLLRVPEVALLGQTLLLAAHGLWQFNFLERGTPPWWNPVALIAMTLALGHWWQKQKAIALEKRAPLSFQLILSLLFVLLVCRWLGRECSPSNWLAISCILAAIATVYAVITRAWLLAACAQIFLLPALWLFVEQLVHHGEFRFHALAPIIALGLLSAATIQWFKQKPNERVQEPLLKLAMAYRWVALVMSLWWVMEYVQRREQIWTLMAIGFVVFAFAGWRKSREAILFGGAFSALAMLLLWCRTWETDYVYLPNVAAILLLLGQQEIVKRLSARYTIDERARATAVVIGGLTLWLFISRWVLRSASGFYLTASWSALALVFFTCGMALRERMYRWLGLAVLAGALGRVVVFDVWKLETIYRIFSFMALGIVLLVLGFVYNKCQEKIRQWL